MNVAVKVNQSFSTLIDRLQVNDPLTSGLIRKTLRSTVILVGAAVLTLWLAGFLFGRLFGAPAIGLPQADQTLREARRSTEDVVRFLDAPSAQAPVSGAKAEETYPAAIDVQPLLQLGNPFLFPPPPPPPAPEPDPQVLALQKQLLIPIAVKGIVSDARTNLAVLASGETVRTVSPGDAFLDWQVLAVGRDRVLLGRDGMTRTVAWEGSK